MCDTPKSSRTISGTGSTSEDFKLVSVPATNTPKVLGNLTGNHRIVRDCVADIYNSVQHWNKQFLTSVEIIGQIKTVKFDVLESNEIYHSSLHDLCQSLNDVVGSMSKILDLLRTYEHTMRGVEKLLSSSNEVLFSTWKISTFVDVAQQVLNSYQQELKLKTYIKENIAHVRDRNNVAFYFITWVNEAFISEELGVQLEAMLVETGHR